MAQKAVKSISITVGGTTFKIIESATPNGASVESIDVTDFLDVTKVKVPTPQPELIPIPLVLADDGTGVRPTVGTPGSYAFTVIYTDGSSDTTVSTTVAGFLSKAEPATMNVSGERRPVWNCELVPTGTAGTSTTTTTTTSQG
jgi:hypothetical protein